MSAQQDNPYLTITLTDRPPIRIKKEDWPVVASAEDGDHDNQYRSQANITSDWRLKVRQHEDGRTIIYGLYDYRSNYQNSRQSRVRGGEMMDKDSDLIAGINRVVAWMRERTTDEDQERWESIRNDCIADLPAIEIE